MGILKSNRSKQANGLHQRLLQTMEKERHFTKQQFQQLVSRAEREDRHVVELMLESSAAQAQVLGTLSDFFQAPIVDLRSKTIPSRVLNLIPKEVAAQHAIVIFKKGKGTVSVATTRPENEQTIDFIRRRTGLEPQVYLTTAEDINDALRRYESDLSSEFAKMIDAGIRETNETQSSTEQLAQNLPIVTMVQTLLERAIERTASDIHLEPTGESVVVRYRIDGLLQHIVDLPREILASVVARIKLLANLKLDEHRVPQDGRFSLKFNGREVAVRVSTMPTLNGTKVALRLLDTYQQEFSLASLGLNDRDHGFARRETQKPHGMILVTGPTGSGKTTTLYTMLRQLNREDVNICTIEDPIEYGMPGINQTQVNAAAGLTFSNGLRALLRQDPNVVMVGEIRDLETATIAVNAAMTGHLVLSTMHTNSGFQAVQRLHEMGVDRLLTASVLNVVIGQRLVRRVCPACSIENDETRPSTFDVDASIAKLKRLGLLDEKSRSSIRRAGPGCGECRGTGYRGRIGIYEVISFDDRFRPVIAAQPSAEHVRNHELARDITSMVDDGVLKAIQGVTTIAEVARVVA